MPRTIAITGGGGFVGQWLARASLVRGDSVWLSGIGRRPNRPSILSAREWDSIRWSDVDVRNPDAVGTMVKLATPDAIVHLAGLSSVPNVEKNPTAAYEVNVLGVVNVAQASARLRAEGTADPVLLVVGSATQYGIHDATDMPLAEDAEQRPVNTYAATKAAQEIAALQIGRATGLRVICTRSFNHSGVGHDAAFLLPSMVARIRNRKLRTLPIGNDVVRDYLHVDDVVEAYLSLIDGGGPGEVYNVCSGRGISVRELAETVIARAGVNMSVSSDVDLQRAADMPILVGSPEKLRQATGWSARKNYVDIIDDLLAS